MAPGLRKWLAPPSRLRRRGEEDLIDDPVSRRLQEAHRVAVRDPLAVITKQNRRPGPGLTPRVTGDIMSEVQGGPRGGTDVSASRCCGLDHLREGDR